MEAYMLARPGATPASIMAMESSPGPLLMQPPPPQVGPPVVAAVNQPRQQGSRQGEAPFLCFIHQKYGTRAYSCKPSRCPMHDQVQRRPAPGNSRAGR